MRALALFALSNIPLVQYYRQEKQKYEKLMRKLSERLKLRLALKRKNPYGTRKAEREARHQRAATAFDDHQQNEVQSALSRVKRKHGIGKIIAVKARRTT